MSFRFIVYFDLDIISLNSLILNLILCRICLKVTFLILFRTVLYISIFLVNFI